mgnify:CR=1 FL=1
MEQIKLKEIAQFINGFAFKPTDWSGEGLRIIRIQNLTDNSKPYNHTKKRVPDKYFVNKGDILISWSATIDVYEWNDELALLNQHIFRVEFNESKVDKTYFKQALKKSISELSRFAHGSTMKHLLKKDFENHKIPLPPLDDQKRIAKVLTDCEALIQKRKESINLLDTLLKSTFLEMFGDPKKFDSKTVKEIASNERYALSSGPFGSNLTSKDYKKDGVKILRGTNISSGELDLSDIKYISEDKAQELKRSEIKPDDVVIVAVGSSGTALKIPKSLSRAIMSQNFNKVTPNQKLILPSYLEYSINSEIVQRQFRKVTTNAGRTFLGLTKIKEVRIPLPDKKEQQKFDVILNRVSVLKDQSKKSLKEIENLYNSITQRAFKGELDLNKVDILDKDRRTGGRPSEAAHKTDVTSVTLADYYGIPDEIQVRKENIELDFIEEKEFYQFFLKDHFRDKYFLIEDIETLFNSIYIPQGVDFDFDTWKEKLFSFIRAEEPLIEQVFDEGDKIVKLKLTDAAYKA